MSALRLAVRGLVRSPELTFAALLTLIIAAGANTAVLAVGAATVFRQLPFTEPDRLVELQVSDRAESGTEFVGWSYPLFERVRAAQVVDGAAAFTDLSVTATDSGRAERLSAELVTSEYFPTLGLSPLLGRAPIGGGEVMLSHALWRTRYGGDPSILGASLGINRKLTATIVGVAPEGFAGLTGTAQLWLPLELAPQLAWSQALGPTSSWLKAMGRLRAGSSLAASQEQLSRVFAEIDDPRFTSQKRAATAVPIEQTLLDPTLRKAVLAVLAASALLLLAACANLANLLLARSASRAREAAVQVALGATFWELLKQHAATAIVLGVLGVAGGILVAQWGIDALLALRPPIEEASAFWRDLARGPVHLGGAVLGLAAAEALLIALLAAVPAAIGTARIRVADALHAQASGGRGATRLSMLSGRGALVIVQVALAIALAAGAALLFRTFERLRTFEPGFSAGGTVALRLYMPMADYGGSTRTRFLDEALRRASTLPGVAAASVDRCLPLSSACDGTRVTAVSGRAPFAESEQPEVGLHFVDGSHFEALGIPVRSGRSLGEGDREGAAKVVVLNETAAKRLTFRLLRRAWPQLAEPSVDGEG